MFLASGCGSVARNGGGGGGVGVAPMADGGGKQWGGGSSARGVGAINGGVNSGGVFNL